jgi:hypothetical protein
MNLHVLRCVAGGSDGRQVGLLDCKTKLTRPLQKEVSMTDSGKRAAGPALLAAVLLSVSGVWANEPGPGERAGKAVDKAAEKTGKALKKAGEKVGEGVETAGKAVQRAGKKTGEAVGKAVERTGAAVERAGEKVKPSSDKK